MPSVTAFTAARSLAIEQQAVVGAEVVNGDLIMRRQNNSTFSAGSVAGPEGPPGPTGDVSAAQLAAAVANLQSEISNSGLGVVGRVSVAGSAYTLNAPNAFEDIPGASVTFTPSPGRLYRISGQCGASSAAGSEGVMRLIEGASNVLASESFHFTSNNWMVYGHAENVYLAPVGWNVAKTIKMQFFTTYAGTLIRKEVDGADVRICIEDLGTP